MRIKCRRCNTSYRPCIIDTSGRIMDKSLNCVSDNARIRIAWYCPNCTRPYEIAVSEIERNLALRVGSYQPFGLRKINLRERV